ncbi:MAG: DUF1194 domain-containing protein [Crocosphaera sp.]|nr:DUF1194 domain-containing protein [Crocosphaera sp.]
MKKYTLISKGLLGATGAVSILGYGLIANAAELTPVSLELAIIIDGSQSISEENFNLQLGALDNIFNDPNFYNDFILPIKDIPNLNITDPSVAVGIFQFGAETIDQRAGNPIFETIMDWTLFNEQRQSGIGTLNPNTIHKIGGFTPLGDLLPVMIDQFSNNDYEGHRVVNISSDGFETFSETNLAVATREAFRSRVTFNGLVIPAIGGQVEKNISGDQQDNYNLKVLESMVDRYPFLEPREKNNNLAGNPAFLMLDYATGEKTLEEAFRLKLGLETIGRAPASRSNVDEPGTDPTAPTSPGTGIDPTSPTSPGTGIDPNAPTSPGTGSDPTAPTSPGTGTIGEPTAQHIPEPGSLLGLLSVGLLGVLRHKKKA